MSVFIYNGVSLKLVKTRQYRREAVYSEDRTDRLYDHITLTIEAVYNPGATSYSPSGFESVGFRAPQTDAAIRERLMEERKTLIYGSESETILQSPPRATPSIASTGRGRSSAKSRR